MPTRRSSLRGAFRAAPRWSVAVGSLWIPVTLVALAYHESLGWYALIPGTLLETTVMAALLVLLVNTRLVQELLGALPRWQQLMLLLLAMLSMTGQALKSRPLTFPFVDWRMYSDLLSGERITILELEGVGPNGERYPLSLGRVLPPVSEGRLYGRLERLEREAAGRDAARAARAAGLIDRTIAAVLRVHEARWPERPLAAIELYRLELQPAQAVEAARPGRVLVRRVTREASPA